MVKAIFLALHLLLLVPKVRGQDQFFVLAMLKTLSTKFRNSKCGQGKKNCFQPPIFNIENKKPKAKKLL
jgi:hypothetical protein